jgi:hypothetical protein
MQSWRWRRRWWDTALIKSESSSGNAFTKLGETRYTRSTRLGPSVKKLDCSPWGLGRHPLRLKQYSFYLGHSLLVYDIFIFLLWATCAFHVYDTAFNVIESSPLAALDAHPCLAFCFIQAVYFLTCTTNFSCEHNVLAHSSSQKDILVSHLPHSRNWALAVTSTTNKEIPLPLIIVVLTK